MGSILNTASQLGLHESEEEKGSEKRRVEGKIQKSKRIGVNGIHSSIEELGKGGGGCRNDATLRTLVLAPRDVGTSSKQLFL
ncbi:uncharacterized [Tachysurus ichikawai]